MHLGGSSGGGSGNSSSILICLSLFFAHKQLSRAGAAILLFSAAD
jgi:hypothetical protein